MALKDITLGQYFPGNSTIPPAGPPHEASGGGAVYRVPFPGQEPLVPTASCSGGAGPVHRHLPGAGQGPWCGG